MYDAWRREPIRVNHCSSREGPAVIETNLRADVFAALRELSESIPEMRAGQIVAAIGELCADLHGRGLWDVDDAELFEAVWLFRRSYEEAVSPSRDNG
jgi:hypothetical protein